MRLWPRREGSSLDLLVVGLGNPGREYARNRHNAGWMVVDELARRHGGSWKSKFNGQLSEIRLEGHKLALLKPETYMNESGRAVGAAAKFFKVDPDAVPTLPVAPPTATPAAKPGPPEDRVGDLLDGVTPPPQEDPPH